MKMLSVNAGLPRTISQQGRTIETAICKSSVAGTVRGRALNLDGDRQADLTAGEISRLCTFDNSDFAAMGRSTSVKLLPASRERIFPPTAESTLHPLV